MAALAAVSSKDVWAVGADESGDAGITMTIHWDGSTWSLVPSPNIRTVGNVLRGAGALPDGQVWAVGSRGAAGAKLQSLILHLGI